VIQSIICYGRSGLLQAFPGIPVQMCQFHQIKIIVHYLSKKPKSEAARELWALARTLTDSNKDHFTTRNLHDWLMQHEVFLSERSVNTETGRSHYTHKKLRSTYHSLKRHRWCSKKYADTGVGKQKLKRQRADALCCVCENTINTLLPPLPWAEYKEKWHQTRYGEQNYLCKDCCRQFIGDHNLTYIGCRADITKIILKMLARNCGIRDISEITGCSRYKVQKVLKTSQYHVLPKKNHYDTLEIDEILDFRWQQKE